MSSAALLLLVALPAWSARVTDVRVGKHPTFTRVVFELDAPTGYKLERNEPAPGIAELIVSLKAQAGAKDVVTPKSSLVKSLAVDFDGRRSVARIRLAKDGLRLKEMILSKPPRIVLDVLLPDGAAPIAKATPKAKPVAKVSKPAPKPVAKVEPKPAARPTPKPVAKVEPRPAPAPVAKVETPKVEKVEVVEIDFGNDASAPASPSGFTQTGASGKSPIELEGKDAGMPSDPTAPASADSEPVVALADPAADAKPVPIAMANPAVPHPPRSPAASPKPRTSLPAAPAPAAQSEGLLTARNGALALAGVVLLVAGGYVVARRRTELGDVDDDFDSGFDDENPFAGLEGEAPAEDETPTAAESGGGSDAFAAYEAEASEETDEGQANLFAAPAAEAKTEPVAVPDAPIADSTDTNETDPNAGADSAPAEGNAMSFDPSSDFNADPNAMTTMPPAAAPAGVDTDAVMNLVREMESRIGNLEKRLEEAVDARERLERQVAAQTEELRVQRAAIARTQRAVRNMSQPIEDTPTEPALRQPQE